MLTVGLPACLYARPSALGKTPGGVSRLPSGGPEDESASDFGCVHHSSCTVQLPSEAAGKNQRYRATGYRKVRSVFTENVPYLRGRFEVVVHIYHLGAGPGASCVFPLNLNFCPKIFLLLGDPPQWERDFPLGMI